MLWQNIEKIPLMPGSSRTFSIARRGRCSQSSPQNNRDGRPALWSGLSERMDPGITANIPNIIIWILFILRDENKVAENILREAAPRAILRGSYSSKKHS